MFENYKVLADILYICINNGMVNGGQGFGDKHPQGDGQALQILRVAE